MYIYAGGIGGAAAAGVYVRERALERVDASSSSSPKLVFIESGLFSSRSRVSLRSEDSEEADGDAFSCRSRLWCVTTSLSSGG